MKPLILPMHPFVYMAYPWPEIESTQTLSRTVRALMTAAKGDVAVNALAARIKAGEFNDPVLDREWDRDGEED